MSTCICDICGHFITGFVARVEIEVVDHSVEDELCVLPLMLREFIQRLWELPVDEVLEALGPGVWIKEEVCGGALHLEETVEALQAQVLVDAAAVRSVEETL